MNNRIFNPADERFLPVGEVAERYKLGVSTVWEKVAAGGLPQPLHLTERTTRWALSDLVDWEISLRPTGNLTL